MKKLFVILFLFLMSTSTVYAREYCSKINEMNKVFDVRAESFIDLIFLSTELKCLGKTKASEEYKYNYDKAMKRWVSIIMPFNPKGSKNRYKICGQKYLNNNADNLADPKKAKKYHNCEDQRIKKAEEELITYLYELFYKLEKQ
tara:strand:- start:4 stop:435 length:432 start_codon:yes stop_codon:yes gene_type:complete